jgi:hypothetical protein
LGEKSAGNMAQKPWKCGKNHEKYGKNHLKCGKNHPKIKNVGKIEPENQTCGRDMCGKNNGKFQWETISYEMAEI